MKPVLSGLEPSLFICTIEELKSVMLNYQHIIDALVKPAHSIKAEKISNRQSLPETTTNAGFNDLLQSLSEAQRGMLAQLLQQERQSAIHDALVVLSELMNLDELRFSVNGRELEHEPYGTELYFDWVARVAGDPWPDNQETV